MKMIWCPETATKAYIDAVKSCGQYCMEDAGAPEMIAAMAGGWKANLIVEAWSSGPTAMANSIGLAIAAHHSGGRHVCIVDNEKSRQEYISAMQSDGSPSAYSLPEVMVGKAEELMESLVGIDFLVVNGGREDCGRVLIHAKFGHLGAVIVHQNGSNKSAFSGFRWSKVLDSEVNVVKSMKFPIGNGLDIAYIAGEKLTSSKLLCSKNRWIKHMDQRSGEEHVFRR